MSSPTAFAKGREDRDVREEGQGMFAVFESFRPLAMTFVTENDVQP